MKHLMTIEVYHLTKYVLAADFNTVSMMMVFAIMRIPIENGEIIG